MKNYQVDYTPAAKKALAGLDKSPRERIQKWIEKNLEGCENPRQYGESLEGDLRTFWRYRVGDYRLVAEIQDDKVIILIVGVDKRNDVYKKKNRRNLK